MSAPPVKSDAALPAVIPEPTVEDESECQIKVGHCPTSTVREYTDTGPDRIHVTTQDRDRTRCGQDCAPAKTKSMDSNAGEADEMVVAHLGTTLDGGRMCPECARRYLGTKAGDVSWRHRLASVGVYGKDTRHHLGGTPEVRDDA